MKKYGWVILFACTAVIFGGCAKKETESMPLISEEAVEEETPAEVIIDTPLNDMEFSVEGKRFQLPMTYEEVIQAGWIFTGDADQEIEGQSYVPGQSFTVGETTVTAELINYAAQPAVAGQCYISNVIIEASKTDDVQSLRVSLPENIMLNHATEVQAQAAYGNPTDRYEGEGQIMLTYEMGLNKRAIFTFDSVTEVLVKIELCNREDPADENLKEEVSQKPTDAVKQYQKPEAVADDFLAYTVSYGQGLYQLPAPVAEFVDAGWEIQPDKTDMAIKPKAFGYATLTKDEQNLYAVVYNVEEENAAVKNCFVTLVYADLLATKVPITISHGITLGMPQEKCLELLANVDYEKEEDEKNHTVTYYIYQDEDKMDYTSITIDSSLALVSAIKVVHYPEGSAQGREELSQVMKNIELMKKGM